MCCESVDPTEPGVVGDGGRVTGFCIVRMNGSVIVISASKCKNPSNNQPAEPNTHDRPCPAESLLGNVMVSNSRTKKRKTAQYYTYNSRQSHKRSSNEPNYLVPSICSTDMERLSTNSARTRIFGGRYSQHVHHRTTHRKKRTTHRRLQQLPKLVYAFGRHPARLVSPLLI